MNRARLRRRLLAWFDRHRRDLPWRHERDAYRIWVSEVMLQQTTVAAVIPYFDRFIAAFPTLADLARADEQHVLKLWQGLGYYRRARHLHQAARLLHSRHGHVLPDSPEVWQDLPGVGRYILGAVLSQAFDARLPIVEANSLRVLSRLFAYSEDPRSTAGQRWLWSAAESLLPRGRTGDFNQAMMELGSQVCTIRQPRCSDCPLQSECAAHAQGLQEALPIKAKPKATIALHEVALLIWKRDRLLWCRRPATAQRWASLWEAPRGVVENHEDLATAAYRIATACTGLKIRLGERLTTVRYGVTRYAITLEAFQADWISGRFTSPIYERGLFLPLHEVRALPSSSPQTKLLRQLVKAP